MFKNLRRVLSVLCLLSMLFLAGCNTMEGLGQDARAAGDALTGAAKDNKGY